MDRDEAIKRIREGLKRRTGRTWSVTGGRGTAWGWITVDAPPARQTWRSVPNADNPNHEPGMDRWHEIDTGERGGHTGPEDRKVLADALGLPDVHHQGVKIPASSDYRREYVERAEGRPVTKHAEPYWD